MSEEMAAKFLSQFKDTDLVRKKLQMKSVPLDDIVRIAAQLGFEFTTRELQNVLAKEAPAAEADGVYELNAAELGTVAGGIQSVQGMQGMQMPSGQQMDLPTLMQTIKDERINLLSQQIAGQVAAMQEFLNAHSGHMDNDADQQLKQYQDNLSKLQDEMDKAEGIIINPTHTGDGAR